MYLKLRMLSIFKYSVGKKQRVRNREHKKRNKFLEEVGTKN